MTIQPAILEDLAYARLVANYANRLGVSGTVGETRRWGHNHMGAVLADAVLQAGLNYRNVVRMRVDRIQSEFPNAATVSGALALIDQRGVAELLLWQHQVKLARFERLTRFLATRDVETCSDLRRWLSEPDARTLLLELNGIGPKTCDYLGTLVGIDCIAVDRHIKTFVERAGVMLTNYDRLKSIVSFAADLLGVARREFDSWIWTTLSADNRGAQQLSLI